MTTVPPTMRAVRSVDAGKASEDTLPTPVPGPHDVLVKVAAVDVNPADWKTFNGLATAAMQRPYIPGCDLAGTVVAVGAEVTSFHVGDEVFGMTGGLGKGPQGTLAEYAIAWDDTLAHKPKNLSMREAAAIPLVLTTAWEGLMDRYTIKPTDVVLVTGGSGGVGNIALQLAKAAGAAQVYGLASAGKRDLIEKAGATFIDYQLEREELLRVCREKTPGGRGFDVVFDAVGGDMIDVALELVAPNGYISTIIAMGEFALDKATMKAIHMSFPFAALHFFYPTPDLIKRYGHMLRHALPLIESGKLVIQVDETHRFRGDKDGVVSAFKYLESGKNRGKVVIDVEPNA